MASRVAQQDAKRQLSNGKKENGKTTMLIVTHGFPTLLKQNPARTLSQSRTSTLHYAVLLESIVIDQFIDRIAIYPNV